MLIVTGSDNNYAAGVLVLIASAAFHNPDAKFAVLDMGISPPNRAAIDRLALALNIEIQRIEVSADTFDKLLIKRGHLTRSTYLRLLIPTLFPAEDRAVYMDCDMAVTDSLSLLDQIVLDSAIIAAVPCPSPNTEELAATGYRLGEYVNAGLLVMNLPVWRSEHIADACMELLSDPSRPLLSEDQSAINIVAKGRMKPLPSRFNVYSDAGSYQKIDEFPETPAVVHYVVNNKPWDGPTNLDRIWHFHAERIAELMPACKKVSFRRQLSLLNRRRKMTFGLLAGNRKYKARHMMATYMNSIVTDEYLLRARSIGA